VLRRVPVAPSNRKRGADAAVERSADHDVVARSPDRRAEMIGAGAGERQQKVAAGACEEVGRSAVSLRSAGERRADDDVDATRRHAKPNWAFGSGLGACRVRTCLPVVPSNTKTAPLSAPAASSPGGADEDQRAR
jgi:hypothetical protein